MNEGKRSMGKQRVKMLDGLIKWLKVGQTTYALKEMRDKDMWKVVITFPKEHVTRLIEEI